MRAILTKAAWRDTPGPHHDMLADQGFEIVRERGPLPEKRLLELAGDFDAFLCGDDAITRAVLEKPLPRLKVVAKYGIGLDKMDVAAATTLKMPVTLCPGELEAKAAKQSDIHDGLLFTRAKIEGFVHIRSELGEQAWKPEDFRTVTI